MNNYSYIRISKRAEKPLRHAKLEMDSQTLLQRFEISRGVLERGTLYVSGRYLDYVEILKECCGDFWM